jgi:hypothetical protein
MLIGRSSNIGFGKDGRDTICNGDFVGIIISCCDG